MPVNDWIAAGKAGAKAVSDNFTVAREYSPDYQKSAQAKLDAESAERIAATKAAAKVHKAGLQAVSAVKETQIDIDSNKKILDKKIDNFRKAGIVGALGTVAAGGLMGVENNRAKKLQAERDAAADALDAKSLSIQEKLIDSYSQYTPAEFDKNNPEHNPGWGGNSSTNTSDSSSTSTPVAAKPTTTTTTTVAKVTAPKSRQAAFNEIYELAKKVGGTKFPEVVAAQSMHETGWLSAPNSVYKATGGTNPFGQTGDRGYGTIPRKGFKDGWTIYPDKETAVRDHIKLWHDTKNHSGNYNAFDSIREGVASVAPAYSPNSDPENIRKGYTVDGYSKGLRSVLEEMGYSF